MLLSAVQYSPTVKAETKGSWQFDYDGCNTDGLVLTNVYHSSILVLTAAWQKIFRWKSDTSGWHNIPLNTRTSCYTTTSSSDTMFQITSWYDFDNYDYPSHNNIELIFSVMFLEGGTDDTVWFYQSIKVYPSSNAMSGYEMFWKMDWAINGNANDYIDHKVVGAWTPSTAEGQINAQTLTEGVRYRGGTRYAYSTNSDVIGHQINI
jgi:hypothetical protein